MKTCSFRGAQPRSSDEGLFCGDQLPSIRYGMQPCHGNNCKVCHSLNNDNNNTNNHELLNGASERPCIQFSQYQVHYFSQWLYGHSQLSSSKIELTLNLYKRV